MPGVDLIVGIFIRYKPSFRSSSESISGLAPDAAMVVPEISRLKFSVVDAEFVGETGHWCA